MTEIRLLSNLPMPGVGPGLDPVLTVLVGSRQFAREQPPEHQVMRLTSTHPREVLERSVWPAGPCGSHRRDRSPACRCRVERVVVEARVDVADHQCQPAGAR
jgi:hypothetical protein